MLVEVKVPQLSESVAEAMLLAWHKKAGEAVKRDENLVDFETDKVVAQLPAAADGVVTKVPKGGGSTLLRGEANATIHTEAKAASSASATSPAPAGIKPEARPVP